VARIGIFFLLLFAAPAMAHSGAGGFAQPLAAQVFASALSFMAPRTLDRVSIPQMTMWGLRGLTTLDPRLTPTLGGGALRLVGDAVVLGEVPQPEETDAAGWANAAAQVAAFAWTHSEAVRRARTQGIIVSFFDELFNHLDPYSRYEPPLDAETDRARRSGRAGAGLSVGTRGSGVFVVDNVANDGPADDLGIVPGDRLLALNGQRLRAPDSATVNTMLAGPEGSELSLTLRGRDGRIRNLTLTRELVPPETVFADRRKDVLTLRVTGFSRTTERRVARALNAAMSVVPPPRGLVIDLRGNRGGLLRQAVAAAETVLPEGVIATTVGRNPDADHEWEADGTDISGGLPIVVLVDGRTASAAEILAAALADDQRAVVVGSTTLGKGLVQAVAPLPDGGELLVTWSRVLAPQSWPIQGLGVLPQVCTSLGQDALDRQLGVLAEGRQPMQQVLARHRAARAPLPIAEILEIRGACPAAEGRDLDMEAANFLLNNPNAYAAALIPAP
jgi:carboxyl-terminal processing protease